MSITSYSNTQSTIFHGDAMCVLEMTIPDGSVDLIFADPPYNIGKRFGGFVDHWKNEGDYTTWCEQWLTLCLRKLKTNGSLYVMGSTQYMPHIDLFLRDKMTILSRIIWAYDSSGVQAKKYFGSTYEPILHCVMNAGDYTFNSDAIRVEAKTGSQRKLIDYRKPVPTPYNTTKVPGNVWNFPRVRYRMPEYEEHPTQKPEVLLERIIRASSNSGDVVLDPFSGSFTTGAVAQRLDRHFIGIEQEWEYIKIGLRRLGIPYEDSEEVSEAPKKRFQHAQKKTHAAALLALTSF